MSAARPPPPRKPNTVKVVRALFPYEAQQADELTFDEGDVIYISELDSSGWWKGSCKGKTGLIPSNYVEEQTENVMFPLHDAARRGNMDFFLECIQNRVSVNLLDKSGCTAAHWAAHAGNTEIVNELLRYNIDLNYQNKMGDTPLHMAAYKGHPDIVNLLLEHGADGTIRNNDKKLASDLASDAQSAAALRYKYHSTTSGDGFVDYGGDDDSD